MKRFNAKEFLNLKQNDYMVWWRDHRGMLHPQLCQNCVSDQHAEELAFREYIPHEYKYAGTFVEQLTNTKNL